MRIIKGRLLDQTCDALVLPVTGYIDSDRCAVFCEEPSLEAATKWKPLSVALGERISRMGSCTQIITTLTSNGGAAMSGIRTDEHIIAFPTRPGRIYHEVDGWDEVLPEFRNHPPLTLSTPGWMCKSNLRIIQFSTEELVELTEKHGWHNVGLPRFAPDLDWADVRAILDKHLDDRFILVEL